MDIAKYMTTAVLLTSLFAEVRYWHWLLHLLIVVAIIATLGVGLWLMKPTEEQPPKTTKYNPNKRK